MKEAPLEMTLLYDFYGETLTEKQRDLFNLYYNNDYSLSEIAENVGITRQGVRDVVNRAEHILRGMEERLGLRARAVRVHERILKIQEAARLIEDLNQNRGGLQNLTIEQAKLIQTLASEIAQEGI